MLPKKPKRDKRPRRPTAPEKVKFRLFPRIAFTIPSELSKYNGPLAPEQEVLRACKFHEQAHSIMVVGEVGVVPHRRRSIRTHGVLCCVSVGFPYTLSRYCRVHRVSVREPSHCEIAPIGCYRHVPWVADFSVGYVLSWYTGLN